MLQELRNAIAPWSGNDLITYPTLYWQTTKKTREDDLKEIGVKLSADEKRLLGVDELGYDLS